MRVVSMPNIIHVLESHLKTPEAAGIVLDLLDYVFELETSEEGCKECNYSWWNGVSYDCSRPVCRFESKGIRLEDINESTN